MKAGFRVHVFRVLKGIDNKRAAAWLGLTLLVAHFASDTLGVPIAVHVGNMAFYPLGLTGFMALLVLAYMVASDEEAHNQ